MDEFVKQKCRPFVRELTFVNAEQIISNKKPVFVLFYNEKTKNKIPEYITLLESLKSITGGFFKYYF